MYITMYLGHTTQPPKHKNGRLMRTNDGNRGVTTRSKGRDRMNAQKGRKGRKGHWNKVKDAHRAKQQKGQLD